MDFSTIKLCILPLLLAITLHEAAHGFVASWLGDDTAKKKRRVTLNPLRHIDPVGTLLIPGGLILAGSPMLFGYAKPVPVNFRNLRHPRRDSLLVALAGPATNLVLAFISALLLHLDAFVTPEQAPFLFQSLYISITVNVVLAVFNMLPLMPLDGGRVLNALLPEQLARIHAKTERTGIFIVFLLFLVPRLLHLDLHLAYYLIAVPADVVRDLVLHAAFIGNS